VPEAIVKFSAAGHIRFGIGGGADGDLANDTQNEFLPVIVVPISGSSTYYRKIFVENLDIVPYYKWKISVESNRPEVDAQVAFEPNPDNFIRNAQTAPQGVSNWGRNINGLSLNIPLFGPNETITFWLRITASPAAEKYSTYTITLTFEGYS